MQLRSNVFAAKAQASAVAPIQLLAQELSCATGEALKTKPKSKEPQAEVISRPMSVSKST